PSGTVQFFEGTTPSGAPQIGRAPCRACVYLPGAGACIDPLRIGFASMNISGLSVGVHTFTAVYSGDPLFAPSTSAPFTITVNPITTRTNTATLAQSSTIIVGQQATRRATIAVALADYQYQYPSGTVQFFEGTTPSGAP